MNKHEFISRLRSALENDLNSAAVSEHVNYYTDYINSEIRNGRSEADVISELGDPWAIAKNIISAEEVSSESSSSYDDYSYVSSENDSERAQGQGPKVHVFGFDRWWKKLLLVLGIIGIVMLFFYVIGGIISLIAPFIIPVILISAVIKLFKKR